MYIPERSRPWAFVRFGRNTRDSLFLVYCGVQYLPDMYFANAAALVACSLIYTALVGRIERARLLSSVCLLFVVSLILSRLLLFGRPHWFSRFSTSRRM
jgi:ATP/ADP translocase